MSKLSLSCSMPSLRNIYSRIKTTRWQSQLKGRGEQRTMKLRESLEYQGNDPSEAPFFSKTDEESIVIFGESFELELRKLKNASPTAEGAGIKTKGGYGEHQVSPSKLLYPDEDDYSEVNRTIVGALALKWIVKNDYDKFTSHQVPAIKLTQESFGRIRKFVMDEIQTPLELYALVVSMIINDLGKEKPETDGSKEGQHAQPNHDRIIKQQADDRQIPLLEEFSRHKYLYEWLKAGLEMGADLNVPQFAQAENVPRSLSSIKVMRGELRALNMKIIEIILDVAGAQGHVDSRCAKAMMEPTWKSFDTSYELLVGILEYRYSECEAYDMMLEARAKLLQKTGFQKLSTKVPEQRALLRLVTMGRSLEAKGNASLINAAFKSLGRDDHQKLVDGLSVTGVDDGTAVIPYYAPSLFANFLRKIEAEPEPAQIAALATLLRFLTRVYRGTRPQPGLHKGMVVECKLDFLADMFTGAQQFRDGLARMETMEIPPEQYTEDFDKWLPPKA